MSFYSDLAADASGLIAEFGAPIVLVRKSSEYDPEEGVTTDQDTHTGMAVRTQYSLRDIDGTLILQSDVRLLVSAADNMPQPEHGDSVSFDGNVYTVVNATPLRPADVTLYYDVQARIS